MRRGLITLGAALLSTSACGGPAEEVEHDEGAVIAGTAAGPVSRGMLGALFKERTPGAWSLSCTAAYIGQRHGHHWALTAAHCISPGLSHAVVFGGVDTGNITGADLNVAVDVRTPPAWTGDPTQGADLALIRLTSAPPSGVVGAPLATAKPTSGNVTVVGYGADDHDVNTVGCRNGWVEAGRAGSLFYCEHYPTSPLQASLGVIANADCSETAAQGRPGMLCLGGNATQSTCHGDSGGPAHVAGELVGIASYGNSACGYEDYANFDVVYTSVANFRTWVETNQRAMASAAFDARLDAPACAATMIGSPSGRSAARAWASARNFECALRCVGAAESHTVVGSAGCNIIAVPRAVSSGYSISGGSGEDLLFGSNAGDVLRGGGGADDLRGMAGNDTLYGGPGVDALDGGGGTNQLIQD